MCFQKALSLVEEKKPQRSWEFLVKEGKAPGFSTPLTMKRVKIGETVVMECVPYGKPFPEIKWLKDGIELVKTSKVKVSLVTCDYIANLINFNCI